MGLLDDAIREHLELKRKRGGDLSEIDRQEHEALGPVRRTDDHAEEPEAALPPADDGAMAHAEPVDADPPLEELEHELDEEFGFEPAPEADVTPEPEPVADPEPVAEAPAAAPEREAEPEPEPVPDHLAQPTVEFSVEDHLAEPEPEPEPDPDVVAPDDEAEDVLEETPDFLQETPEHDRLWFEQKPPRDFDFDG